ncbi:MAG TPA: hypothetical protein VF552_14670 [Allosphingosinicella sp.]|jgi:hypothetical protein
MLSALVALSLVQASAAAPAPVPVQAPQGWTVAASDGGCLVHTAQRAGTVLSVFALPEEGGIGFLLQNTKWTELEDGQIYPLSIRFDDGREWPIPALARTQIDEDGPGLFFAIPPGGEKEGRNFIEDFSRAAGMRIANGGALYDNLRLTDSRGATLALAQCLRTMIEGEGNPFSNSEGARTATRI